MIDSETRKPIPLVNIYLRGTQRGTATDENGAFTLAIPGDKKQVVAFSHIGYKKDAYDVELDVGEEFKVEIELVPGAVAMDEVTVTATKPFNEVMANYVITEKQIESISAYNLRDVLRWYAPQVFHAVSALTALRRQSGFTLYVDNMKWEPMYIEAIDPYTIKKINVWRSGWAPIHLRMDYGSRYLVQIVTR